MELPVFDSSSPQLLAVVEVAHDQRVRCGNPGCGHSVYKAIHIVQMGSERLVLGSTCFDKRFGRGSLGNAKYGRGVSRPLTPEERELLISNTVLLLQQFEDEMQADKQKLESLQVTFQARSGAGRLPAMGVRRQAPWEWMKPMTSMAGFKLRDGSGWVRAQHRDGRQMLAPWPSFEGWDETLPAHLGSPQEDLGAIQIENVSAAIAYLRERSSWERISGIWTEIAAGLKS
jgi:hypothetical protein